MEKWGIFLSDGAIFHDAGLSSRHYLGGRKMKKKTSVKLSRSIIIVIVVLVIAGIFQAVWGSIMLRRYTRQNEISENSIVSEYLSSKDISFSYLYQDLQQMIYESDVLRQASLNMENENATIFSHNNTILEVKSLFQQMANIYGNELNFFYYNPDKDEILEYGSMAKVHREEFLQSFQEKIQIGQEPQVNGKWYMIAPNMTAGLRESGSNDMPAIEECLCLVIHGRLGYIGCYMAADEFIREFTQVFPNTDFRIALYDFKEGHYYAKALESGSWRDDSWEWEELENVSSHRMDYGDFYIVVQPLEYNFVRQIQMQIAFTMIMVIFLLCIIFVVQYTRHNILDQVKCFYNNILKFSEQVKFQEENGIMEFSETGKVLNCLVDEINRLKIDIYEKQLEKQKVELDYAQLQVRPHFYINCLNVIGSLAQVGENEQITRITLCVSKYLRFIFNKSMEPVPLAAELNFIKDYLKVVDNVNGMECHLRMDIEEGLEQVPVPPLMIQTFVENSVKYGADIEEGLNVWITVYSKDSYVEIIVDDSGKGIDPKVRELLNQEIFEQESQCYHVGIPNAAKRMHMLYGMSASLWFGLSPWGGCRAVIKIPRQMPEPVNSDQHEK